MTITDTTLPEGPLVSWYGDDFTGAAAVMEVMSFAGLPSVLFVDIPTEAQLQKFSDYRGIGVAGTARSHSPQWMNTNLPPIYEFLFKLNTPITHYKVCSTFDSSPEIGSIGRALDIAAPIFKSQWIPCLIAAPVMRRYQCCGQLFAGMGDQVYRIDRHPVMSCHPVTPMKEADLTQHLAHQTDKPIDTLTIEDLIEPDQADKALRTQIASTPESQCKVILLDTINEEQLTTCGQLLWHHRDTGNFSIGSQGIEYALVAYWRSQGLLQTKNSIKPIGNSQMIAVSGSVSPVTADQIQWALDNGFIGIALNASALISGDQSAIEDVYQTALEATKQDKDVLIYSARGPSDPAVKTMRDTLAQLNFDFEEANNLIGKTLGTLLARLLKASGLRRASIMGGDTSGHASIQLGIYAFSALAPIAPGAALLTAHSENRDFDGLQLSLKGGQMGTADYLGIVKQGGI